MAPISQGVPSLTHNLGKNALVLARVLFELKGEVEIEDVLESPGAPTEPLPSHLPCIVLYLGTPIHRMTTHVHSPSLFLIFNVSSANLDVDTVSVHTPSLVV